MSNFYNKDSCCLLFDKNGHIVGLELDKKEIKGIRKIHTFTAANEAPSLFIEVVVDGFSTKQVDNK